MFSLTCKNFHTGSTECLLTASEVFNLFEPLLHSICISIRFYYSNTVLGYVTIVITAYSNLRDTHDRYSRMIKKT